MTKKNDIDILIGETIVSCMQEYDKRLVITCASGKRYAVDVDDDGCGGNDSYACIVAVNLIGVMGQPVTTAYHQNWEGGDGCRLVVETAQTKGDILITHESNGFYGYSYEVNPILP